jgi:hypothetical protein
MSPTSYQTALPRNKSGIRIYLLMGGLSKGPNCLLAAPGLRA